MRYLPSMLMLVLVGCVSTPSPNSLWSCSARRYIKKQTRLQIDPKSDRCIALKNGMTLELEQAWIERERAIYPNQQEVDRLILRFKKSRDSSLATDWKTRQDTAAIRLISVGNIDRFKGTILAAWPSSYYFFLEYDWKGPFDQDEVRLQNDIPEVDQNSTEVGSILISCDGTTIRVF